MNKDILCSNLDSLFGFVHCSGTKNEREKPKSFSSPDQPRTGSLHIIVKFELKMDLFWNISLFYRSNAFIVFVQIQVFKLFISICSWNCRLPLCCELNFKVPLEDLFIRLAWHPESFLLVSSCSPPSLSNLSKSTYNNGVLPSALCFIQ